MTGADRKYAVLRKTRLKFQQPLAAAGRPSTRNYEALSKTRYNSVRILNFGLKFVQLWRYFSVNRSEFVSLRLPSINISIIKISNTVRAPALPRFRAKLMCHPVCLATQPYGTLLVAAQRCEWNPRHWILVFRERLLPSNKFIFGRPSWVGLRSPSHLGLPDRCYRSFLFLSNPES